MPLSLIMAQTKPRQLPAWVVAFAVAALTVITFSLLLILGTVKIAPLRPDQPDDPFLLYVLTAFNFVAFTVFLFIWARLLIRLRQERRAQQLGSRLKTKLVWYFIVVVILPLVLLGVFSYGVINVTIEKWFGEPYQNVLREALSLSEEQMADEVHDVRQMLQWLQASLDKAADATAVKAIIEPALSSDQANDFLLIQVVDSEGRLILSQAKPGAEIPSAARMALSKILQQRRPEQDVIEPVWLGDGQSPLLVAVMPVGRHGYTMAALYQPRPALAEKVANIRREHDRYQSLYRRQGQIRRSTFQVLGLVTFLLLFVATWTAIHLAKGITIPIEALADATRRVAMGDLTQTVNVPAQDELAMLVQSFNQMTAQLNESRVMLEASAAQLRQTNLTLDERRRYIETVLESLSTGIISFDSAERITTLNHAARRILHLNESPATATALMQAIQPAVSEESIHQLRRMIQKAGRTGFATVDVQMHHGAGVSHLIVSASALRDEQSHLQGMVVMLEDITELVRAQRQAVWSEVARRMAHEIKNPLTPIQLSAQRILKHLDRADALQEAPDQQMIRECMVTIIGEVHTLQRMVNEFTRFARLPPAVLEENSLNQVVASTLKLYEDRLNGIVIESVLDERLPVVRFDAEQIKRALVNLIDNALEAVHQVAGEQRISVHTRYCPEQELAQIIVSDTGIGIDPKDYAKLFTPYFSKRPHGTGLGLSIVNRIIAEHHGRVRVQPNQPRGVQFIIELPTSQHKETEAHAG